MPYELFFLRIPAILLALTVHELAHGWTALRLGDPTAKNEGRVTLNPIPHLDLLGTVMLMTGLFGWAKPVPVNPYNLRSPKRDMVLISLAGPLSNIVQAMLFGFAVRIIAAADPLYFQTQHGGYLRIFLLLAFMINAGLAFFNMLPFYPLDGSKIVGGFLSDEQYGGYMRATRYALPVIFGLVIIDMMTGAGILHAILAPVFNPYMSALRWITFGSANAFF
jgi:Zn-dependent protease